MKATSLGVVTSLLSHNAGGLFTSVREPRLALLKIGIEIDVYGISDKAIEEDIAQWKPLRVHLCDPLIGGKFLYAPSFLPTLLQGKHDIVHLHGLWTYPTVVVNKWSKLTRRPYVVSAHGMADEWALRNNGFKKRIASALYQASNLKRSACLHALNDSEMIALRRMGLTNPIAVIPNGINLTEAPFRRKNGSGRKTMLMLSRIHPKKGLKELIAAWRILRNSNPQLSEAWKLEIAGWDDGNHLEGLKRNVADAGLNDCIEFVGPLFGDDKVAAYQKADAFILPSYSEGLPMTVLEAWANRICVFMTPHCNLSNAFALGAAIEIDTAPDAIARTLEEHLPQEARLQEIGNVGRTLIETRYNWGLIANNFGDLYRWLLHGGSAPDFVCFE